MILDAHIVGLSLSASLLDACKNKALWVGSENDAPLSTTDVRN